MFENDQFKTGEDYYHRLNFLFNLFIAIPLVPFGLLYLGRLKNPITVLTLSQDVSLVIDAGLIMMALLAVYHAISGYKKNKLSITPDLGLRNKMIRFHQVLVQKYLWLTGVCILFTIGFLLTQAKVYVVAFISVLIILSLGRPSLKMIVEELKLPEDEAKILRDREQIT